MKKLLSILLTALLLTSSFISCANNEPEAQSQDGNPGMVSAEPAETTVETEASYVDTLGEKDFDGASYVVVVSQQGTVPAFAEELTGEVVNDALYKRDLEASNNYNVVIEYPETADSPSTANNISNCVLAGDYYCDLYMDALSDGANYMGSTFRKGALYNLLEVPYLRLDQKWWSELLYDKLQYKGKMFFTSGDIATASYYAPSCTFMNLGVANSFNIDATEIYNLVYENAWTLDEMMKRTAGIQTDLNGDGVMKTADDLYGVVSATVELTSTQICVGAGIRYCDIDEDGNMVVNLNTEQVLNTIDKLRQCFCEVKSGDDWGPIFDVFKIDRELFLIHFVETSIKCRDMESDFSILPMPKYDADQASYMSYTNPHTHSYVAIPLIQEDIERTGFLTEVLEYLSVDLVRPTIYDVTLKGKVSRDQDCQAMLDIIFNTTYIDFNTLCNFGGSTQTVCNALFGGADFVSAYEKNEKRLTKELEKVASLFE